MPPVTQLSVAQETWGRALFGWETKLSGTAAIGDLGWVHIAMEAVIKRCSLFARMKGRSPTSVSSICFFNFATSEFAFSKEKKKLNLNVLYIAGFRILGILFSEFGSALVLMVKNYTLADPDSLL